MPYSKNTSLTAMMREAIIATNIGYFDLMVHLNQTVITSGKAMMEAHFAIINNMFLPMRPVDVTPPLTDNGFPLVVYPNFTGNEHGRRQQMR